MSQDECCARCAKWKAVEEKCPKLHCADDAPQYWGRGECRAEPPKAGKDEDGVAIAVWPVTKALAWCAGFAARKDCDDGQRDS